MKEHITNDCQPNAFSDKALYRQHLDELVPLVVGGSNLPEGSEKYNHRIDVLRHHDRASVYQAYVLDAFAVDSLVYDAAYTFHLIGDAEKDDPVHPIKWMQILEHMAGVMANATATADILQRYGGPIIDRQMLRQATLLHDIEKPAELAAAQGVSGAENSPHNPVVRDGHLWRWMEDHGASDDVIIAAQNTGRSDRYFSDFEDYTGVGDAEKSALLARENLVLLTGQSRVTIDDMSADERRQQSIAAKGPLAAIVGLADAMSSQFRFQGMSDEAIDTAAQHYSTYKTDPESQVFFQHEWPAYYKQVRRYLISLVPPESQAAIEVAFLELTHKKIFNETVLPAVLGTQTMERCVAAHRAHQANPYDDLKYKDET